MKVYNKENLAKKINLNFDYKNFKKFIDLITEKGHYFESKSNPKKLNYSVVLNSVKTPCEPVHGWVARTSSMQSTIFMDFDNQLLWQVELQLEILLNEHNLSKFYIFYTHLEKDDSGNKFGNFLCFCPDIVNFNKVVEIQDRTTCDQAYKRLPLIYRFRGWVTRWSSKFAKGKPKYLGCIENPKKPYKQKVSWAHLKLMKQLYPEIKEDFSDFKNMNKKDEKLWIVKYLTSSK